MMFKNRRTFVAPTTLALDGALLLGALASLSVLPALALNLPITRRAPQAAHSTSVNVSAISQGTPDPFDFVQKPGMYGATIEVQGEPFVVRTRCDHPCYLDWP